MEKNKIQIMHLHATRINVGDNAIVVATYAACEDLLEDCSCRFFDVTTEYFACKGEPIDDYIPLHQYHHVVNWRKLISLLLRSNLVLVGGGELVNGSIEYLGITILARILRIPVVFYGIGVNLSTSSRLQKFYTIMAMKMVNNTTVRDLGAYNELKAIGVKESRITIASDIVFYLAKDSIDACQGSHVDIVENNTLTIGVSLRTTEFVEVTDVAILNIAKALDVIIERWQVQIVFYPFFNGCSDPSVINDICSDTDIIKKCISHMKNTNSVTSYCFDNDLFKLQDSMRGLDLFVGMRLHSLILAVISNVSVIGLSYAPKIDRFFSLLGVSNDVIKINNITSEDLIIKIEYKLTNRVKSSKVIDLFKSSMLNITTLKRYIPRNKKNFMLYLYFPFALVWLALHSFVTWYYKGKR